MNIFEETFMSAQNLAIMKYIFVVPTDDDIVSEVKQQNDAEEDLEDDVEEIIEILAPSVLEVKGSEYHELFIFLQKV